jgi:HEAT repeat protein
MTRALCVLAAVLPLAAQPKLLVNAQLDTRSGASGLEGAYRALLTAQPQPAWIGYTVPAIKTTSLGCDFVRDSYAAAGVVHLEPPDHAVILFRVENNALTRIRALSPNCEIDAGGVPMHWLTDVQPAQSVALLQSLNSERDGFGSGAVYAIAMHADPSAERVLEGFLASNQPESLRLRAVSYLGARNLDAVKRVIANDSDIRVRERAVSSLSSSRQPEALTLLTSIAKTDADARLRSQAASGLGHKSGAAVVATLTGIAETDKDLTVRRRAISALQSMPDSEGVPALIQMAKTQSDLETRKQAMQSLQHSRDPRALAFFEEVIRK